MSNNSQSEVSNLASTDRPSSTKYCSQSSVRSPDRERDYEQDLVLLSAGYLAETRSDRLQCGECGLLATNWQSRGATSTGDPGEQWGSPWRAELFWHAAGATGASPWCKPLDLQSFRGWDTVGVCCQGGVSPDDCRCFEPVVPSDSEWRSRSDAGGGHRKVDLVLGRAATGHLFPQFWRIAS